MFDWQWPDGGREATRQPRSRGHGLAGSKERGRETALPTRGARGQGMGKAWTWHGRRRGKERRTQGQALCTGRTQNWHSYLYYEYRYRLTSAYQRLGSRTGYGVARTRTCASAPVPVER